MASFWKVDHWMFCCILAVSTAYHQQKVPIRSNHLYCCFLPQQERQCLSAPPQQQIECAEPVIQQMNGPPLTKEQCYSQQIDCLPLQKVIACFDPCIEDRPSDNACDYRYAHFHEKNTLLADDRSMMGNQNIPSILNPYQDALQAPTMHNKLATAPQNVNNRLKPLYKTVPQQFGEGLPSYQADPVPSQYYGNQQRPATYNVDPTVYSTNSYQSSHNPDPSSYHLQDNQQIPSSFGTVVTNGQLNSPSDNRNIQSPHTSHQNASPYNTQRPSAAPQSQYTYYQPKSKPVSPAPKYPVVPSTRPIYDTAAVTTPYADVRQRSGPYNPTVSPYQGQDNQAYQFEDYPRKSFSTQYRDDERGPPFYNPATSQLPPNAYQADTYQPELPFHVQPAPQQKKPWRNPFQESLPSFSLPQDATPQKNIDQSSGLPQLPMHTPGNSGLQFPLKGLTNPGDDQLSPASTTADKIFSMTSQSNSNSDYNSSGKSTCGPKVLLSCFSLLEPFEFLPFKCINNNGTSDPSPTSTKSPATENPTAKPTPRPMKEGGATKIAPN